MKIIRVTWP